MPLSPALGRRRRYPLPTAFYPIRIDVESKNFLKRRQLRAKSPIGVAFVTERSLAVSSPRQLQLDWLPSYSVPETFEYRESANGGSDCPRYNQLGLEHFCFKKNLAGYHLDSRLTGLPGHIRRLPEILETLTIQVFVISTLDQYRNGKRHPPSLFRSTVLGRISQLSG